MKKYLLTVITICILTTVNGQNTEFRFVLNSGLFYFTGQATDKATSINYNDYDNSGYTNNPYGSIPGLCVGLSGNLQRVTKGNFILGADLGGEILRSKVQIDKVNGMDATGRTYLNNLFLNLYPFWGYRIKAKSINLDLTGGIEFAHCFKSQEAGKATASNGIEYTTSRERHAIKLDVRPRIQLSMNYKKMGVYLGYSYGIPTYTSGLVGGSNACFARMVRFGVSYQIK